MEEKLEAGQGKTAFRRFFSRFCTPIFLEVCLFRALTENSFEVIYDNVLLLHFFLCSAVIHFDLFG